MIINRLLYTFYAKEFCYQEQRLRIFPVTLGIVTTLSYYFILHLTQYGSDREEEEELNMAEDKISKEIFFFQKWPGFLLCLFDFQIVSPGKYSHQNVVINKQHSLCNYLKSLLLLFQKSDFFQLSPFLCFFIICL